MKHILFLFLILGFSCGNKNYKTTEPGKAETKEQLISLKVKDCFDHLENGNSICLDSVYKDSRCPKGITCVWEGDAIAAFTLTNNEKTSKFELHTNFKFQNEMLIDGSTIKLLGIDPYPIAKQKINSKEYKVDISVVKN